MNGCTLPVMGSVTKLAWWCEWCAVQRVVVQQAVEPVVHKLRRAGVQKKQLPHPRAVPLREAGVAQHGHLVHEGHDDGLQDDEVVPVVLAVDLLEVDALGLNFRVLRDVVHAAQGYPELRVHVPQGGDREHVERPVVAVVLPERHGGDERDEQQVLERAHVLPRELVPEAGLERHGGRVRSRVRGPRRGNDASDENRRRHQPRARPRARTRARLTSRNARAERSTGSPHAFPLA